MTAGVSVGRRRWSSRRWKERCKDVERASGYYGRLQMEDWGPHLGGEKHKGWAWLRDLPKIASTRYCGRTCQPPR
jgi:hypothetical protein